jgi:glycine hydroxymethyltransferase
VNHSLSTIDPHLYSLIAQETARQENTLSLIASENYTWPAVLQATASVLTNKYAEGYPGKRYYAGCAIVDQVESLAIERCKLLFGSEHANVQPHAGCQANMAVYFAILKPRDTIMGMRLSEGGHLTHGHDVNFSGTIYKSVSYGLDPDTQELNYDSIEQLAHQHKPKLIIAGASAYSKIINFERFASIAKSVGAYFMADIAHIAGLVAAKLHPSPVGHADFITSTTHKTLRGPRGGLIMTTQAHAQVIDRAIIPGTQGGPFMHSIAAKAVGFGLALQPDFIEYQKQILANAQTLAHALQGMGYRLISGGTQNHMLVIDLRKQSITGLQAELVLEKAGITSSRSCIPGDPQKPWITSGIRFGTPAITSRGFNQEEVITLAQLIDQVIKNHLNETQISLVAQQVKKICTQFPVYPEQSNALSQHAALFTQNWI